MEWDIQQWRNHRDQSEKQVVSAKPATISAAMILPGNAPGLPARPEPSIHAATPTTVRHARRSHEGRDRRPAGRQLTPLAPKRAPVNRPSPAKRLRASISRRRQAKAMSAVTIDLTTEFAYESCVSCGTTGWILRTGHNEDGTWRYWCVRCSRAFKTPVRLAHGRWPFVVSGFLLGGLALLVNLR